MTESWVGATLGKCRLERKLGEGGMGAVYLGRHVVLGSEVAVKLLSSDRARDPEWRARFVREARMAARLDHPNAVRVHDVDDAEGLPYLVMDLVRGRSLGDLVREQGPLPWREAVDSVRQALAALEAAHALGIIHRDIKPDNLMRSDDGVVKVTDFGLAREVEGRSELSTTGQIAGSPAYMSPEQADGSELGPPSDVYSLGLTLYALIAGASPFRRPTLMASLLATTQDPTPVLSNAPAELSRIVCEMTAKRALERPTLAEVDRRLVALLDAPGQPGAERGPSAAAAAGADTLVASGAPSPRAARRKPSRRASRRSGAAEAPEVGPLQLAMLLLGALATGIGLWAVLRPEPRRPLPQEIASSPASQASPQAGASSSSAASSSAAPSPAALAEVLRRSFWGQRPTAARAAIERLVATAHEHPTAIAWAARLQAADGELEPALQRVIEARRIAPAVPSLMAAEGWLLAADDRLDEALARCDQALAAPRPSPHWRLERALLRARAGRLIDAAEDLALPVPSSAQAFRLYASARWLATQQRWHRALERCRTALQLRPDEPTLRRLELDALSMLGRWQALIAATERLQAEHPDLPGLIGHLALACRRLGKLDDALRHATLLTASDPSPQHLLLRANLLRAKGLNDQALLYARKAIRSEPKLARAHAVAGDCLRKLDQLQAAMEAFETALRLDPEQGIWWAELVRLRRLLKLDDREAQAMGIRHNQGRRVQQINGLARRDRPAALLRLGATVLRQDPENPSGWTFRAMGYHERSTVGSPDPREDLRAADLAYLQALRFSPAIGVNAEADRMRVQILERRAKVRESMLDFEGAVADMQRSFGLQPPDTVARFALTRSLHLAGRFEEAAQGAEAMIKAHPSNYAGYYRRARARLGQGDLKAALADMEASVLRAPQHPLPTFTYAGMLLLDDQRQKAIPLLQTSLRRKHMLAGVMLWILTGARFELATVDGIDPCKLAVARYARGEMTREQAIELADTWDGGRARMRGWIGWIDHHRKPGSGRRDLQACAASGRTHWIQCWAAKLQK